jgi:hypothetical protein
VEKENVDEVSGVFDFGMAVPFATAYVTLGADPRTLNWRLGAPPTAPSTVKFPLGASGPLVHVSVAGSRPT